MDATDISLTTNLLFGYKLITYGGVICHPYNLFLIVIQRISTFWRTDAMQWFFNRWIFSQNKILWIFTATIQTSPRLF